MKPKISIVVPIYNIKEKILRKCIETLVNQTLKEIEIILIDDGSTNKTLEICEEYKNKDNRIIVIKQENEGVSVARNNGIKIATADWISFVDADDWVEPNCFEKLLSYTNNKNDSDIIMCACFVNYKNRQIENSFYDKYGILDKKDKEEILLQIVGQGKNKKYPKEAGINVPWAKLYNTKFLKENNLKFVKRNNKDARCSI